MADRIARWLIRTSALAGPFSSGLPVALLYHGVPEYGYGGIDRRALESHVSFLSKHCDVVALGALRSTAASSPHFGRPRLAITFDDGYGNNAEIAAPILRRYGVPATFFVCSRHSRPDAYLWFSYLEAMELHFRGNGFDFHGEFIDMSPQVRRDSISRLRRHLLSLRPHPAAMYEEIEANLPVIADFVNDDDLRLHYSGLSEAQIGELADDALFEVGAHTEDHPFLTACTDEEAMRQLGNNKSWIEQITGKACNEVAYPSGDYDEDTIEACRRAGFYCAFAVDSRRLDAPGYEMPRVGIYSQSVKVLAVKSAFGNEIRAWRVPVG